MDPAWWDFFEGYKPDEATTNGASTPRRDERHVQPQPHGATNGAAVAAPAPAPSAKARPRRSSRPRRSRRRDRRAPTPPRAPFVEPPDDDLPDRHRPAVDRALRAGRPARARRTTTTADEATDDIQKLRGPAARVVTNMEASLEVPTATSVRAVPAKLMVDNRIVINNHLARGRGGKISFTHLIGFAMVEALAEMPAMNASYVLADDKPSVLTPGARQRRHRDRPGQAGRHASAARPVDQEVRDPRLRRLLGRLRGRRAPRPRQQAHGRRLRRARRSR